MKNIKRESFIRLIVALIILLSGVAMIPHIVLPTQALNWQLFANVYEPDLTVNYPDGRPGSYFTFTGSNFPANTTASILVNGDHLGQVLIDGDGNVSFIINTDGVEPGQYTITVDAGANASASQSFTLDNNAPLRDLEGNGPIFNLLRQIYLPVIVKR